jgi:NAD(P)-dependent dehydrogenase (short-subunit alcohol dehydrogenase family)
MSTKIDPKDGVAWVTGASQGIGEAVCLRLARDGWTVIASARSADKLEALAAKAECSRIVPLPLDVTDGERVQLAVETIKTMHGPIALAVLNAGTYLPDNAETVTDQTLRPTVELNLLSVARCIEVLVPAMRSAGKGHVQVVSSVSGYRGLPDAVSYGATKAALINMAESMKLDFDRLGLRLQLVNPGFVKTPLTDRNSFPMPFLVTAEKAADRMVDGLARNSFEITFPRRFTFLIKILRCLPYALYFPIIRRITRKA